MKIILSIVTILGALTAIYYLWKIFNSKSGKSSSERDKAKDTLKLSTGEKEKEPPVSLIWNLPHNRNPNFTGRERLLDQLRSALSSGKSAVLIQATSGLGGLGKTQLAIEYAYRHAQDYRMVWWIKSEEPVKLADNYSEIAQALKLPEKDEIDQRVIIEAVKCRLGQDAGWLLIFDNAHGPAEVRDYLPPGGRGHILITSRNPDWGGTVQPLPVEVLNPEESVELLRKRTRQSDEEAAAALAGALGHLPLALEQARAYMEETGISLNDYLKIFQESHQDLMRREISSTDYPSSVATTGEISFQRVQEKSPEAMDLLNLCAFLAPDDIPLEIIKDGAKFIPEPLTWAVKDEIKFDDLIAALIRYSLIERDQDYISIHRLVQAVTRNRMEEKNKKEWCEAAVQLVNSAFRFASNDAQSWPLVARLLPHALEAAAHSEPLKITSAEVGRLLHESALYLEIRAQLKEAKDIYKKALAVYEVIHGPEHPKVATVINHLGGVLQIQGNLEGAKAYFERALRIDEAAYGPEHPDLATVVNNLGMVLKALGDPEGAKAYFERALRIYEATYGPEHPTVAAVINNLGGLLKDLGDLEGTKTCFERALSIDEATYGPDHPTIATRVNNIGGLLKDLGDLEGARACYERALKIDEAAYGPNHPHVATSINNLGSILRDLGDLEEARACIEWALRIDKTTYGPDHPNVARDLNNLGMALKDLGDLKGAKECHERALRIDKTTYGPDHPNVAIRINNLGDVLQDLGDPKGAKECYERALRIDEAAYGPDHPNVAIRINNLGDVLQDLGDPEGAKECFERALRIDEAAYGPDHPNVATGINNLGNVLRDLGDLEGAKECFERALRILKKFYGEDHPNTKIVKDNLEQIRE
jgi:tetratricopeptide (TPR) repeat protein